MRVLPKPRVIGGGLVVRGDDRRGLAARDRRRWTISSASRPCPTSAAPPPGSVDRMLRPPPESPAQQWVTLRRAATRLAQADHAARATTPTTACSPPGTPTRRTRAWPRRSVGARRARRRDGARLRNGDEDRRANTCSARRSSPERTAPLGTEALHGIHEKAADALQRASRPPRRNATARTPSPPPRSPTNSRATRRSADTLRARAEKIVAARTGRGRRPSPAPRERGTRTVRRTLTNPRRVRALRRGDGPRILAVPRETVAAAHRQAARLAGPGLRAGRSATGGVRVLRGRRGLRALGQPQRPATCACPPAPKSVRARAADRRRARRHVAAGRFDRRHGWRGPRPRTIDAQRGYDDVGVRLVHECRPVQPPFVRDRMTAP